MTKRTWWLMGAVAVAAALVAMWMALTASVLQVETGTVTRGTVTVTVDDEGRTRVRDRYVVAAPIDGRVARLTVIEGHRVLEGDVLASIYPSPVDPRAAEIARSQSAAADARRLDMAAQVEKGRAAAVQAGRELARMTELARSGDVSQEALEQARLAVTSAGQDLQSKQAALRAAEADVAAARAVLIGASSGGPPGAAVIVRAPTAGRVLRVVQQSARVVQAGMPLLEIGDATGLEAVIDVLSEEAVQIKPGDPVRFDQWGGDATLQGNVRLVEPDAFTKVSALGVEEQRVNVIVDLFDAPSSLGVGYRVQAHIVTWTGETVLSVPTSALFQQEGAWTVFKVQEGRAMRRNARIGHRSAEAAEVLEGLMEGERVVLYPSAAIADGVKVEARP